MKIWKKELKWHTYNYKTLIICILYLQYSDRTRTFISFQIFKNVLYINIKNWYQAHSSKIYQNHQLTFRFLRCFRNLSGSVSFKISLLIILSVTGTRFQFTNCFLNYTKFTTFTNSWKKKLLFALNVTCQLADWPLQGSIRSKTTTILPPTTVFA